MPTSTPPQPRPPKTMSSRLMTMKFMQRAAASTPPATPQSETNDAEPPPSKRQKTSNVPSSPAGDSSMTDLQMIQRALDEEEQKRVRAIEKLAEDAGETKWVLSTVRGNIEEDGPNLHVTTAGYSEIDEGTWRPHMLGRRSFGRFNRQLEKHENGVVAEDSMSGEEASQLGDDDDGEHSDDPAGVKKLIQPSQGEAKRREHAARLERKQRKRAEKAELARLADKRRKKEVKLNKLSSISGVNGSSGKPGGGISDKECFVCGEKGHVKRDCPQRGKRKNEDHLGGDIKRSKPPLDY